MIAAASLALRSTARTVRALARSMALDASRDVRETTDSGTTLCCFNAHGLAGT